ncbi:hypothetical protein CF326_g9073 [Tilletia indica]|nr:hypothetical protein CF326_g9073 [Tilletia indica]
MVCCGGELLRRRAGGGRGGRGAGGGRAGRTICAIASCGRGGSRPGVTSGGDPSLRHSSLRDYRLGGDKCAGCFDKEHVCNNCEDGLDNIVKQTGACLPASRDRKVDVEDEEPRARHRQPSGTAISTLDLHARIKLKMFNLMKRLKDKFAYCWVVGEDHEHGYQFCLQLKMDRWRDKSFAATSTGRRERRATGADFLERSARRRPFEVLIAGRGTAR